MTTHVSPEVTAQPNQLTRAKQWVVGAQGDSFRRKVFQVQFQKDGSIFINFPYYRLTTGVVSHVAWPASGSASSLLSLESGGKVSSHLVKYSHHPDGRAHFSQTGKVYTHIKKQSVPLTAVEGHLFSLHVSGLDNFEAMTDADINTNTPRRIHAAFTFEHQAIETVKFVGMLHSLATLRQRAADGQLATTMDTPQGPAILCVGPRGYALEDYGLLLWTGLLPRQDQTRETSLLFVGGFDDIAAMNDVNRPVSFLAMSYPSQNPDDLRARLGSIDWPGPQPPDRQPAQT